MSKPNARVVGLALRVGASSRSGSGSPERRLRAGETFSSAGLVWLVFFRRRVVEQQISDLN